MLFMFVSRLLDASGVQSFQRSNDIMNLLVCVVNAVPCTLNYTELRCA